MALIETDVVDALQGGRVIASFDAGAGADNSDAKRKLADTWRGGVISRAERGDTRLTRADVLGISDWRREIKFQQRYMDGARTTHKFTGASQRLAESFGQTAYKAMQNCISSHVDAHKRENAETLRKNAAKYEAALAKLESEETAADKLRDKIRHIKDPERRAQLRAQYPELVERF